MAKTVFLLVASAFLVDGKIAKVGDVVEVDETDAKSLLHRGKATLAVIDPEQLADVVEETDEQRQAREAAETEAEAKAAAEAEAKAKAEAEAKPGTPAAPAAPAKGKGKK